MVVTACCTATSAWCIAACSVPSMESKFEPVCEKPQAPPRRQAAGPENKSPAFAGRGSVTSKNECRLLGRRVRLVGLGRGRLGRFLVVFLVMALGRGSGLLGGRRGGRCVSGVNRTREQGQGNDWDELREHRIWSPEEGSRELKRAYYDWIRATQVPYDRNVMLGVRCVYLIEKRNNFRIGHRRSVSLEGNKRPDRHLQGGKARRAAELGQIDDEAGGEDLGPQGVQQLHGSLGRAPGCDQIVHENDALSGADGIAMHFR